VHEDPGHALAASQLDAGVQVLDVAVDAAVRDQAEQVQRAAGLLGPTRSQEQRVVPEERASSMARLMRTRS